jgi:pSer/pThr/pTyr-binding forkhead associated (FHA) protein
MAETILCNTCGEIVSIGHKFCGGCGQLLVQDGSEKPSRRIWHSLRLIQKDGSDGMLFDISEKGSLVGRTEGEVCFPHDVTVSPIHAALKYVNDRLVVRDLKSLNGTFVRIDETITIRDMDVFQCGEQFLRFETVGWLSELIAMDAANSTNEPIEPGNAAKFFATPRRVWRYKLSQLLAGGMQGLSYCSVSPDTVIGREGCDLNFGSDRYISGRHCAIEQRGSLFYLHDLSSRNGTFVKLKGERVLNVGDSLFVGRQLLRVEARAS